MGEYLCMSFIIRTFILSVWIDRHLSGVVKSETCSGGTSFAEGRLHPALYFYIRVPHIIFNTDLLE
jgi:hypothetical protein